ALAGNAGMRVAAREQWRGQVVIQPIRTLELRGDVVVKRGIRVQTRDFVFVLVREQLEVVARDRLGQLCGSAQPIGLDPAYPLDQLRIATGVGRTLVRGQEFDPPRRQFRYRPRSALELDHLRRE